MDAANVCAAGGSSRLMRQRLELMTQWVFQRAGSATAGWVGLGGLGPELLMKKQTSWNRKSKQAWKNKLQPQEGTGHQSRFFFVL